MISDDVDFGNLVLHAE